MGKTIARKFSDYDLISESMPTYLFNKVISTLEEFGKDPSGIVKNANISLENLCAAKTRISYQQATIIFRNAIRISGDPALGLTIGSRQTLSDRGLLGYAMGTCKNGLECMELGVKYSRTATSLTQAVIEKVEGGHALQVTPLHSLGELLPFAIEEVFSSVAAISLSTMGPPPTPLEIRLTYAPPSYEKKYRELFNCPIHFNSPANRLVYRDKDMLTPFPSHNPITAQLAQQLCDQELKTQHSESQRNLAQKIYYKLLQHPGKFPSHQEVADDLGLSKRTISRSLKDLGTSFQSLLDEAREKLAIEYLQNSNLTLEDIAYLVGFSDAGNFYRAFKKWTGKKPSAYRR